MCSLSHIDVKIVICHYRAAYRKYTDSIYLDTHLVDILTEDCDILVCAFGATARVVKSAVNAARAEGIKAGLFRPKTLWPFPVKEINEAAKSAKKLLSVEMSMGQMIEDVKLAINCSKPVEFFGRTGGVIPTPAEVLGEIKRMGGTL